MSEHSIGSAREKTCGHPQHSESKIVRANRLYSEPDGDFGLVLDLLVPAFRRMEERFVVLIDGGSGSGKTTLGVGLQTSLVMAGVPAQLVSLDQCYPGWGGLAAASDMVVNHLLDPVRPRYQWMRCADPTERNIRHSGDLGPPRPPRTQSGRPHPGPGRLRTPLGALGSPGTSALVGPPPLEPRRPSLCRRPWVGCWLERGQR